MANAKNGLFQQGRHRWLARVARDATLPGAAYQVAILLWDWMNAERGYAWPPFPRIANELGIHRATAIRAVRALSERGWIAIERSTGHHRSNRYRISFGNDAVSEDKDTQPPE
jgi:DNA-binding MarR family transcriptional regulator